MDPAAVKLQALLALDWGIVGPESEVSGLWLQKVELVELEWLLLVTPVEEGHQDGPENKKENVSLIPVAANLTRCEFN